MNNMLLNIFFDDELNMNFVRNIVDNLARPLPLLEIENREQKVRNENYYELIIPNYTDIQFDEHFRMSRETCEELINIMGHYLDNPNEMAPLQKKVLFTVWVLSKQESFLATSDRFGLPTSTGHKIFRFMVTSLSNLLAQYVTWPDVNNYATLVAKFSRRTRFPGIIGAIDGCHIQCKQPIGNEVDYFNRKETHSIILQGTCDHRGKFIDVYIGSPGRMHDSRVFRNSPLFRRITGDNALISSDYHLLGDAAYPLMKNVMTPFRDTGHLTAAQINYNTVLSSARSIIERAFGLLKGKFRRLKYLDISDFELGNHMIAAACVLHNFILDHHNLDMVEDDNVNMEPENLIQQENQEELYLEMEAVEKRNNIVTLLE